MRKRIKRHGTLIRKHAKRHGQRLKRRVGLHILAMKRHSFWRGVFTGAVFALLLILAIEWLLVFDDRKSTVPLQCIPSNLVNIDDVPVDGPGVVAQHNDYGDRVAEDELRASYHVASDPAWRVPIEVSSDDVVSDDLVPGSPGPELVDGAGGYHIPLVHTVGGRWRNVRANPTDIRDHMERLVPLIRGMGLTSGEAKAMQWKIKHRAGGELLYLTDKYSYARRSSIYFLPTFAMSFGANGVAHGMQAHLGNGNFATGTVYRSGDVWIGVMKKCGNLVHVVPTADGGCGFSDSERDDDEFSLIHEPAVLGLLGLALGILGTILFLRRDGWP